MTQAERSRASVLVVESDSGERSSFRIALKALGYGTMTDAPSHAAALDKMAQRHFTHVIFEARKTNMPPREFLGKVLEASEHTICIASSVEPNIDEVFDLLILGARGYLCKPFTVDSMEDAIVMATKGEPIAEAVFEARDRNEALVAVLLSRHDKLSNVLQQARHFETAKREIKPCLAQLVSASRLARTFAKGGDAGLLATIESFCIERSKGPATKLGRLRKRLKTGRHDEEAPEVVDPSPVKKGE